MIREMNGAPQPSAQTGAFRDMALGIAATGVLIASATGLSLTGFPLLGVFFSILIPLPIMYFRSKHGRTLGILLVAGNFFFLRLLPGNVSVDMVFFSGLLLLGLALGEALEKNLSIERTFLYACGIVFGAGAVGLLFYANLGGVNLTRMVEEGVAEYLQQSLEVYRGMGWPEETVQRVADTLDRIQYVLVRILPALAAATMMVIAWINLLAARTVYARRGLSFPDFGALILWKAPDVLVWAAIGCGLMLLLPLQALRIIAWNGVILLMLIYFFQGIAVVAHFFERKRLPRLVRVLLYVILIQQVVLLLVIALGFFDTWINFRKIGTAEDAPGNGG